MKPAGRFYRLQQVPGNQIPVKVQDLCLKYCCCGCRIKSCKNYYEILQVAKDASDSDLKKSYRKLALQLHPDKCKAPGSTEAFKGL